ncbi:MAG: hypothetical protein JJLCMIEE_03108 [Acidimicrobiales bacterium]|nr:MAG: hypothetical protein EDR02_15255 [Actinomycetota bacterium]MBV6509989.1 hypothetical protein [Acidimicrobiales bacterium]RIK04319.1 MAG: hypothetical protein DCC48_13845 [Acidobacteriota bacterium]
MTAEPSTPKSSPGLRFAIFGVPVTIEATLLLIAFLIGLASLQDGIGIFPWQTVAVLLAAWIAIVVVSILVHEVGHAVAFLAFQRKPEILLHGFGGLTSAGGRPLGPARSVVVSLAGPCAGFLIGAPVWIWLSQSGSNADLSYETLWILSAIVWVNVGWGALNLLPVLPLDGGNVMAAALEAVQGSKGRRTAAAVSVAVAVAGAVLAVTYQLWFAAMFAAFFALMNYRQLQAGRQRRELNDLQVRAERAVRAVMSGDRAKGIEGLREVLARKPSPQLRAWTVNVLGFALLAEGRNRQAAELARRPEHASGHSLLRGAVDFAAGSRDQAMAEITHGLAVERTPIPPFLWDAIGMTRADIAELGDWICELEDTGSRRAGLLLLQVTLHEAGRYADAAATGSRAWGTGLHDRTIAYVLARSQARLGDAQGALGWLRAAVSAGFDQLATADAEPDLAPVRTLPGYAELRRAH